MGDPMETFVTNAHNDFTWPNDVPLIAVPSAPPKNTGKRIYLQKIDPDNCECDYHSYDSDMKRYKKLAKEEEKLCCDMRKINHEMNDLLENILNSQCKSEDETMESIYKAAYDKRDYPIAKYRPLMVASVDSSIDAPITPAKTELRNGYRDPIRFRHCPVEIPHIETSKPVDFSRVPDTSSLWTKFQGRTEYMDTISKMGLGILKNQLQYLEPSPSSRRREGDCDL